MTIHSLVQTMRERVWIEQIEQIEQINYTLLSKFLLKDKR